MSRDPKCRWSDDESSDENDGEECPVCHQEFSNGVCPIRSADCPYREEEEEDDVIEEEEE